MRNGHYEKQDIQPIDENLAAIYRQLQDFSEMLCALSDHWSHARPVVLRWDDHRKVLATDAALGTYRAIYGNDLVRGLRHIWKSTARRSRGEAHGRSREPLLIDAPLPADAVLISQRSQGFKGSRYVLTIVSEHEKSVVKIFAKERKSRFDNELHAWRLAQAAGVGHRVPELISSGESPNGFCWLVSRLVRNSSVLYPPVIADWLWRRYLMREILPDLQRFYQQSGVEVLKGRDLLDRLRVQIAGHPMSAALQGIADLAERARRCAGDDRVMLAIVHGDLRPHNVHRHAGQWWLIDWSMSRRAPVIVDLWPSASSALANEVFAAWLRGSTTLYALPRSIRAPLNMCAQWQTSWMGIKPDSDALRFQVLATLLHRLSRNHWSGRSAVNVATINALGIRIHPKDASSTLSPAT